MKICPTCEKGNMLDVNDIVHELDGCFFITKGKRCMHCGEEIINEEEGEKVITIAKRLGVWGEPLKLHRKLSRSARGTVLRIPIDLEHALHLKGNEEVAIAKVGPKKIMIEIES